MALSVPDRWLKYKPYGKPIQDTNLLAFKVPLKEAISSRLPSEDRFTPAGLLKKFPNLKYIIDLTCTSRYYDAREFIVAGVKYQKVMIPGQKVPAFDCVKRFVQVLDRFMSTCAEGELIGIHCTHGVNRTGYLICSYLIGQLGWSIRGAIAAFNEARGYAMERSAYVSALEQVNKRDRIGDPSSRSLARMRSTRWGPPLDRYPIIDPIFEGAFPAQEFAYEGARPPPPPPPLLASLQPHPHPHPRLLQPTSRPLIRRPASHILSSEHDFTADTFEENLLEGSTKMTSSTVQNYPLPRCDRTRRNVANYIP